MTTKEQLRQEQLNTLFDETSDGFNQLLKGLSEDELIEKAKEKLSQSIEAIKVSLTTLSRSLRASPDDVSGGRSDVR